MNSIKRQAASKAGQNKQQRGDSTRSLSRHEKLSCDFCVPATIVKVPSAYFADTYADAWARGPEFGLYGSHRASQRAFGNRRKRKKKTNHTHRERQTFVKYSRLEQTCLQTSEAQRQRDE